MNKMKMNDFRIFIHFPYLEVLMKGMESPLSCLEV